MDRVGGTVATLAPAVYASEPPAAERTLLDILHTTVAKHPHAAAIDDGARVVTYRRLVEEIDARARQLTAAGVGAGDRVGVRIDSGTTELYVAILAVLSVGAAYVPVDANDPAERAELVFGEAGVCAVLGNNGSLAPERTPCGRVGARPRPDDHAWIIFTSGSTGKPKGVAVTHRSAAAFVDAEARLFLTDEPIGAHDRVLAGLSVAFDASCEEMWLAWRHGACLVPAPRSLVKTGVDLGPWLVERRITIVSTVPTLAGLWPADALEDVRLLIFGGESCPPELADRMAVEGREVWNTYGPTEATVVACAARLAAGEPVRIGLPLRGWELAVIDPASGEPVASGESGELVIGGVGLARYLDPAKDAEKYAPLPSLGWERAYRSGDVVRADPEGLVFIGRADEQVKLGGRRIELGEVDAALLGLAGVAGGACAVQRTKAGNQVLVGYVVPSDPGFDPDKATRRLREQLPAALVPLLAVVDDLPTRTSGKIDRAALPWPLPRAGKLSHIGGKGLTETQAWLADEWWEVLGVEVDKPSADFFQHGGGSLTAAQLTARVRTRYPHVSVVDVYQHPTLAGLAGILDAYEVAHPRRHDVPPVRRKAAAIQTALMPPLLTLVGLRWSVLAFTVANLLHDAGAGWAPTVSWWWLAAGWLLLFTPPGRIAIAAGTARLLLRDVRPGVYRRGGRLHLRLWLAEQVAEHSGATSISVAAFLPWYARALGVKVGRDVDLHSAPPVTGLLKVGRGAAVEPEVDLAGYWIDGDDVHVGKVRIGAGARIGARSTLLPGARIGKGADILPGSVVGGVVPAGQQWAGSPAEEVGRAAVPPAEPAPPTKTAPPAKNAPPARAVPPGKTAPPGKTVPAAKAAKKADRATAVLSAFTPIPVRDVSRYPRPPALVVAELVDTEPPTRTVPETPPASGKNTVWPSARASRSHTWTVVYAASAMLLGALPLIAALPGLFLVGAAASGAPTASAALARALAFVPLGTVAYIVVYALLVLGAVRALGIGMREGFHPVHSRDGWQVWATGRLMDLARNGLFPLYASLFTPTWLRLLGARVGRDVEASTVLAVPKMISIADGAFLADDAMVASYEIGGGWLRIAPARIGKHAFVGNSGMTAPGHAVPKRGLVGVLSSAPRRSKKGSSWLGSPPMPLRRAPQQGDASRTYEPPGRLKVARGTIELLRVVPVMASATLAVLTVAALLALGGGLAGFAAALLSGLVVLAAGTVACLLATAMKWLLVGAFRVTERPLWSSFVWRNELADTFVEMLAVPWLIGAAGGTPVLTTWLRTMGVRIGRGVWLESYWLPESDLVSLGAGATVNRGCVVQTHLFHDRIMSMDTVTLADGATLGPHGIVLPGAEIGERTTVGPGSLVTRGDLLPPDTRWVGNPISIWPA